MRPSRSSALTKVALGLIGALFLIVASGRDADATLMRALFVGDSLTANVEVDPRRQYPALVGRLLRGILVQNAGVPGTAMADVGVIPGWSTDRMVVRVLAGLTRLRVVVVMLGTNDWTHRVPIDEFESAYVQFLADVPPATAVVCVTPPWRRTDGALNAAGATMDDYRAAIVRVCAAHTVVDGRAAVPANERFYLDGVHLNAKGNRFLARAVADGIESALDRTPGPKTARQGLPQ